MIKIAILDDNKEHIEDMKKLLSENPELKEYEVFEYTEVKEFSDDIENVRFDIVFLDIILDEYDGIEVGIKLNNHQSDVVIIFVSVNPDYFKDVYKVEHSCFLTKNFEEKRFHDAVTKAVHKINKGFITIHEKNKKIKLTLRDIVYLESMLRHTRICNTSGEVKEYNINIKEIEPKLSQKDFVRVHKSFIVNMNYIEVLSRQSITVKGNNEIPISRSYSESAKEKINLYLGDVL